jgi:DNA-binding SARP family transcriptional activator/nucleotide-binding universal stress UspA family protein
MSERLEFGLLGPVEVRRGGETLELRAKQRALVALLLLNANVVVSTDKLIDELWGDDPPATAQSALQVHVMGLRRLLEPGRGRDAPYAVVVTRPPGYVLQIAPEQLDLHRFERLVAEGSAALAGGRAGEATGVLREALALWRGPALADLAYEPFAQAPASRLEELRLAALEKRIEADLASGRHVELVGELQQLCAEHPLREGLAASLMLALYRAGRQAEALSAYQRIRRLLVDELGIEPRPRLQQLEREILMQDPSLELSSDGVRLPRGIVTLVFTDIEGSTRLLERLGEHYAEVLREHRRLVRSVFARYDGVEVDRQGDGFFFAFSRAKDAVDAAAECQEALAAHPWPDAVAVRVRMGIHTGSPLAAEDGYVGMDVHKAARVAAAAHGGQVVLSRATADRVREETGTGVDLRPLGAVELKGLAEPEEIYQLLAPGLAADFPAPRPATREGAQAPPPRAVLLVDHEDRLNELLAVTEPLATSAHPHELVLARVLDPSRAAELPDAMAALQETRSELEGRGATVRVAGFTSTEVAADAVRLAARTEVDLLAIAAPDSVVRDGTFGADLTTILEEALCDVGFLVTHGSDDGRVGDGPILVPFGAAEHDWAALELGAWFASAASCPLHLLGTDATANAAGERDASRMLADAGLLIQRASGVAPIPRLVGPGREGTLAAANDGGLLVIGVSGRWREEGLGMTRWAIARSAPVPVLFVRGGLRPGGLAPDASMTRFGWSVTRGS